MTDNVETYHVAQAIDAWLTRAKTDKALDTRLQGIAFALTIRIDDAARCHQIQVGRKAEDNACNITLECAAPLAVWSEVTAKKPAPGFHSFSALMNGCFEFRINGEPVAIARALEGLERIFELAAPSSSLQGEAPEVVEQNVLDRIEGH